MAKFIHLRVISSYSLCYGAMSIEQIIALCKKYNIPATTLADRGNLFGLLEFSLAAIKHSIQPIAAVSLKVQIAADKIDQILIIAKNEAGYQNLLRLVSLSFLESATPNVNAIDFNLLNKYAANLIILAGYREGYLYKLAINQQYSELSQIIEQYHQLENNELYIELSRLGYDNEDIAEQELLRVAKNLHIPIVATNDVKYAEVEMSEAQDILSCIATNQYFDDQKRSKKTKEHYFKSPEAMVELFKDLPEAINNTLIIAQKCSFFPEAAPPSLPNFFVKENSEVEELKIQAKNGLKERLNQANLTVETEKYWERLDYELEIIIKMGFSGYFLIVSDFIKWSKENRIPVGPGRGSGAGSMVAYAMKITDLDPLKFGLLFERFLNPERVSMPDFDIDFCQERREEAINYVREKYGHDRVAQIITFGKLQAKAVLKDVGRVLQMPYNQVDRISKMIPFNPVNPVTLAEAIKMDPLLEEERKNDAQIAKLLDIGLKLEGLHRHASTHAAGIVIANKNLLELIPLYKDPKSIMPVVEYSMKYTELAGLVKFDFLGLKTLTVIAKSVALITKQNIDINIDNIALDDKKTFAMLGSGNTIGVFQLESAGMRDCLKKMVPDKIEELIALISLYRPGPMDNIPKYIATKHGKAEVEYPHPLLEECLKETFGVIIYQEQVMQIAQILGGYSLGEADLLRRAMGKKIKSEMDAQREIFVKGAIANNITKQKASEIFDLVAKFAGYGFNKSHAAAYALIGYQTAYLKANFPVEFITATLNLEYNDTDKINLFIQEAKNLNIKILPPDINLSQALFSVEILKGEKVIRYGLAALKSVGIAAIEELIKIRKTQKFKDIIDLLKRCGSKIIQKRQLESLIKSGSLDQLESNRAKLINSLEYIIKLTQNFELEKNSSQHSLFNDDIVTNISFSIEECPNFSTSEKLHNEFEAFGFYLTEHPLDRFLTILKKCNITSSQEILAITERNSDIMIAGVIISYKQRSGKKGRFLTLNLSDQCGIIDISIFDEELISNCRDIIFNGNNIVIAATMKNDDNGSRIIANKIIAIADFLKDKSQTFKLKLNNIAEFEAIEAKINLNQGDYPVKLILELSWQGKLITIDTNQILKLNHAVLEEFKIN
ncbi:MAG: DNA polymerase III subunit alpha [Rickettsiales bacterium]